MYYCARIMHHCLCYCACYVLFTQYVPLHASLRTVPSYIWISFMEQNNSDTLFFIGHGSAFIIFYLCHLIFNPPTSPHPPSPFPSSSILSIAVFQIIFSLIFYFLSIPCFSSFCLTSSHLDNEACPIHRLNIFPRVSCLI